MPPQQQQQQHQSKRYVYHQHSHKLFGYSVFDEQGNFDWTIVDFWHILGTIVAFLVGLLVLYLAHHVGKLLARLYLSLAKFFVRIERSKVLSVEYTVQLADGSSRQECIELPMVPSVIRKATNALSVPKHKTKLSSKSAAAASAKSGGIVKQRVYKRCSEGRALFGKHFTMSHEKAQLIADLIYALVLVIGAIIFVRIVNINLTAILAGLAFWAVAARTPMSILQWLFEDWWGGIYVRMTDMFRVGHWAVVFGCDVIVIEMYRMNTLLLDFSGKLEPVLKAMHQKNSVKNLVEIDDVDLGQIVTTADGERIEIEDEDNGEEEDDDDEKDQQQPVVSSSRINASVKKKKQQQQDNDGLTIGRFGVAKYFMMPNRYLLREPFARKAVYEIYTTEQQPLSQ